MLKTSYKSIMVLCAALAACSQGEPNPAMTAPNVRASLSETPVEHWVGYTEDGPFELASPSDDASTTMAAAAPQAATGSRASGHVTFPAPLPAFGIASEKYSFTALGVDPSTPFAAKGQYEFQLATVAGVTQKVQGDVVCMFTFGNTTRVAGQITKYWRNGVPTPINPNGTHNIWVVVDNGEGAGTTDQVSLMRYSNGVTAQFFCANGLSSVVFANPAANIQVQP